MEELICYDGHLIIAMESSAVIWKAGSADDRPYIEEKRKRKYEKEVCNR